MKPVAKAGVVAGGYVGALAVAWAVVAIYIARTSGPDRDTYAAMFEFGDSLLFLAVFGIASIPATAAWLYFLRPYRTFWRVLSVASLAVATTAAAAFFNFVQQRHAAAGPLSFWSTLAILRILGAPLFALAFLLSGLFAPSRKARVPLFIATAIEAAVVFFYALVWIHAVR